MNLHQKYKPNGKFSLTSRFLLPSLKLDTRFDWNTLEVMGLVNVFLYDETEGKNKYYKNSLLLIFQPSVSFKTEHWDMFEKVIKTSYPTLVEYIVYEEYVYGFWMKIGEEFGENLRYSFKLGKYSQFSKNYVNNYLDKNCQKICNKDKEYQKKLEESLLLYEGMLDNCELASIEDKKNYIFKYE